MRLAVWPADPARALARVWEAAGLVRETVEAEPHEIRARLDAGDVDLALLTTLDVLRAHDGLALVPGIGLVGEAGPRRALVVGSPLDQIRTVGFDPRDGQEALVAQLALRELYDLSPTFGLADLATPLQMLLTKHDAVLAPADAVVPDGAVRLDLAREWTDLTLRPMPWGLVAARAGTLPLAAAEALAAAVAQAEPDAALFVDGVGAYQLTLDGYGLDGLAELAEYLFATGTLSEIPDLPFVAPEPDEPTPDSLPHSSGGAT